MSKHTPGPWEVGMRGGFNANIIFDRSGEDLHSDNGICLVYGMYQHQNIDEQKDSKGLANARLIAAAPELLSELKNLRRAYVSLLETGRDRIIQHGGQCDSVESMEAADLNLKSARAAITKATGDQP